VRYTRCGSHRLGNGSHPRWRPRLASGIAGAQSDISIDHFERLYRRQRAFLKAVLPQLNPPDALALRHQTGQLVRRVRRLNSLGRRKGTALAVAAACTDLLGSLEAWFGEIQQLAHRLTTAELPAQARLALTQLQAALVTQAN
jgi:hypothetical protein